MNEMKRVVLGLILVSWVAGAPMAIAQDVRPAAPQGVFAALVSWLEILVEDLLGENGSAANATHSGGEEPEFQAYIIPGG